VKRSLFDTYREFAADEVIYAASKMFFDSTSSELKAFERVWLFSSELT
jgi:hypothetical protein